MKTEADGRGSDRDERLRVRGWLRGTHKVTLEKRGTRGRKIKMQEKRSDGANSFRPRARSELVFYVWMRVCPLAYV